MLAALLHEGASDLVVGEVPDPVPRDGEVLVRVAAAGVCGSDVNFLGDLRPPVGVRYPLILGHEVAGTVAALGPGAKGWKPGDRVVINPYIACGQCRPCREGRPSICLQPDLVGVHRPGGFAQYTCVPATALLRLPDAIPFPHAAIVPDAVSTPYHALVGRGRLKPGERVVVFGAGGLGTHGIKLAHLMGAGQVIAVVRRPEITERLRAAGADVVIAGSEKPRRDVRKLTDGEGADLVLDFVGRPETVGEAAACARVGGRMVIVGVHDSKPDLPVIAHLVRYELEITGAFCSEPDDIAAVLKLVEQNKLDLSSSVTQTAPLQEAGRILHEHHLHKQDLVRAVLLP